MVKLFLCWLVIVVCFAGPAYTQNMTPQPLTIVNRSTDQMLCTLQYLPISGVFTTQEVQQVPLQLGPNSEETIFLDANFYNFGVVNCAAEFLQLWQNIALLGPVTLSYPDANEAARQSEIRRAFQLGNAAVQSIGEGQHVQAQENYDKALVIVRDMNDKFSEAVFLNSKGAVFRRVGLYDEAMETFRQAYAIFSQVADPVDAALTLKHMGDIYQRRGYFNDALATYNQAFSLTDVTRFPFLEIELLNNTGSIYLRLGQNADALNILNRALEIAQASSETTSLPNTLINLGRAYVQLGQYDMALEHYNEALAVVEATGNYLILPSVYTGFGQAYLYKAEFSQAEENFNRAFQIAQQYEDIEAEANALNDLGQLAELRGQLSQALEYYEQGLASNEALGNQDGIRIMLNNIGVLYEKMGRFAPAQNYLLRALQTARTIDNEQSEASILGNLGYLADTLGRHRTALLYYGRALDLHVAQADRLTEAITRVNIGSLYQDIEEYSEALEYYNKALEIFRDLDAPIREAAVLNNLGALHREQNLNAEALDYYQKARNIQHRIQDRNGEATTLNNLGVVQQTLGQYEEALDFYDQALVLKTQTGDRVSSLGTLNNIGVTYELMGKPADAVKAYQQAVVLVEQILHDAALDSNITDVMKQGIVNIPYQRLATLMAAQQNAEAAFDYAERGRALIIRTELTTDVIDFESVADANLIQKRVELLQVVRDLRAQLDALPAGAADERQKVEGSLIRAQQEYAEHLDFMRTQGGFLDREIAFDTADLSTIQAALPDDTTLITYAIDNILQLTPADNVPLSTIILVTKDSARAFVSSATAETVDAAISAFQVDRKANTAALRTLYDVLFEPIASEITTSRLIVVPDQKLNYIPFAALQASDNSYLIDHYAISVAPSGTALAILSQRLHENAMDAESPGLVISQSGTGNQVALPHADEEAEAVAQVLGVTPIINATETDLRANVTGRAVLHISAHAALDWNAPQFSAIFLGTAPDSDDDGRIEVNEIYALDLSHGNELVVLSGCETASGGSGEDFGMLTRAFFAAGAPRVVASLWRVDDLATAELLTEYIRQRQSHDNETDALQAAMLETRKRHKQPYHWASFVLVGLS